MRILLINPFSLPAAVRQRNLAKAMAAEGNETCLMFPLSDQYSQWQKTPMPADWKVTPINPRLLPSRSLVFRFLCYIPSGIWRGWRVRPDVVHAFRPTPFSGLIGWAVARLRHVPFVLEHGDIEAETMERLGTHPRWRVRVVRFLEGFLTKRADAVTVMNSKVRRHVQETYHPRAPIEVVPNGVDTKRFSPLVPSRRAELLKRLHCRRLVIFHGKLDKVDHILDLIHVLEDLPKTIGVVIIGYGAQEQRLKDLAKHRGVEERVLFLGRKDHKVLPEYLNAADVLVAPFKRTTGVEHASNLKIFEYMAMDKPLVASKVGDIPSILKGCGLLYEPGDLKALRDAILRATRQEVKGCRAEAMAFDWRALSKRIIGIYQKIQDQRGQR